MSAESWIWKAEPVSPSGVSTGDAEDDWFYVEDKASSLTNDPTDPQLYDEGPSRAQVATKLLEELDEYIKEEPFSDWLEEKVEFLFEEIPSPECGQNKPTTYSTGSKPETTQSLLQEFETVLGDVEACHQIYPTPNSNLTPPQTPPPQREKSMPIDTQLLVTLQPVLQVVDYPRPITPIGLIHNQQEANSEAAKSGSYLEQISGGWNAESVSLVPLASHVPGDVASELAAVDEYVRSCAEDLSPSTPLSSSGSSNASYLSSEDSLDDPDWTVNKSTNSTSSASKQRTSRYLPKNRHKPYAKTTIEDKKVRKKEQNKNAATRYRQKKKQEIKEIIGEEQELAEYNDKLHDQVKELQREIGYLKGLMRDLFKAKGLIN